MKHLPAIVLLCFCFTSNQVFSQKIETQKLRINFKHKTIHKIPDLKVGEYYQIIIKDINLNLWKISINTKDTTLSNQLKTPTLADVNLELIGKLVEGLTEVTSASIGSMPTINYAAEIVSGSQAPSKDVAGKNNEIVNKFKAEENDQAQFVNDLKSIAQRIDDLILELGKYRLSTYSTEIQAEGFDVQKVFPKLTKLRAEVSNLRNEVFERKKRRDEILSEYQDDIKKDKKLKKRDENILKNYTSINQKLDKIFQTVTAQKSIDLLSSVLFLEEGTSTYKSFPIPFTEEQAKISLIFTPKDSLFNLQPYELKLKLPIQQQNYWSVGLSFFATNLTNKRYSTLETPVMDTMFYQIIREKDIKQEIGIAPLLRFGKKIKNNSSPTQFSSLGFHGTLGVGITIAEKIKPRLLLGGGISLGSKHSVSIDMGAVVGNVDRKSKVYKINQNYSEKPVDVTISELNMGVFLAIGYVYRL